MRWATVGVLVLALAGCVIFDSLAPKEKRFAFSHKVHVGQKLECADCHRRADSDDDPGMPSLAQCQLCHRDLDIEKPPEHKAETLYDGKDFRASHAEKLDGELLFSHKAHVATGTQCNTCHAGIEQNADVLDLAKPTMDSCSACHASKGVANDCATCHTQIRADVQPESHAGMWQRHHGQVVTAKSEKTMDRCSLCHKDSDCISCHLETPPENHTNYWRRRGHGITASLDRQSCAMCHRSDTCDRCHSETKPMNHVGAWGAPTDRHCLSCHFPLANEGCIVCHKGTPSHAMATPKPPDHSPGMNCRMCHGAGQPLPHVDNGDNCNMCHM